MKNKKICPKCGGSDIMMISNDGHPDASRGGGSIQTGMTIMSGIINIKRYVCCTCGYSEEWIDKSDITAFKNSKKSMNV